MTAQLVHNIALLTTELGRRQNQLRTLLYAGSAVLTTTQNSSANLAATLHELPPTLGAIDSSFAAVRSVLPRVNTAVQSLYPVVAELPAALSAVRSLSGVASPAVHALQQPVQQLVPMARALVPLSSSLYNAVAALLPQVGTINHTTQDLALCKKGVQGFFQWDASMSKLGDVRGPVPRGNVVFGAGTPNEYQPQSCTPGVAIKGTVPTAGSYH
jgi:ABC-type transporter Mla subunit MlaD